MEINETSKHNSVQNQHAKTEGNLCEPWKRIHETSLRYDDLTWRSNGGSSSSRRGRRRRRSEKRVCVSDLEVEETKGFMDLGFVFTEEDLNSELPEILPGLRTLFCPKEQRKTDSLVSRPYLSETWESKWTGRTEKDSMVIDLRMAKLCGETSMKETLKCWARSVASNLKRDAI